MKTHTIVKIAIGLTGYGVWAFMAYVDPAQRADFLKFNIIMATGTIGVVLRDMHPAVPPSQSKEETK